MNNVIQFPLAAHGAAALVHGHVGAEFLNDPPAHSHAVQFYEDPQFLFDTVGRFLRAGLESGDRLLVVASAAHREGITHSVEAARLQQALAEGQLILIDARETLSEFMVSGMPDAGLFRKMLEANLSKLKQKSASSVRVRAFGETVDLLWRDGNAQAAIRLEELWNEMGQEHSFTLLCAYVMGNFYRESDMQSFSEVCRKHSHVMPTEGFAQLDDGPTRLREISLLQQRARSLENEIHHRKVLEGALREALEERSRVEVELRASLRREQDARVRAEAKEAFKEVFLGVVGHDLRNPLNTILTTARLMTIRGELPPESQKRLDRVISSGVRMQRMIEQILDLTRDRLSSGIPVTRTEYRDLVPIVSRIVEEVRLASPGRVIHLDSHGTCTACVDEDRLEQVISNLVGNAITHGDLERPVSVVVAVHGTEISISVHNYGSAIDSQFIPLLFDPFKRARKAGPSEGLGLGLYISDRIVQAHGGRIEVESSEASGTRFEVVLPRDP